MSEQRTDGGSMLGATPHDSDGTAVKRGNMPEIVMLNRADAGKVVSVPVGAEVDITLQSVGPGSFGNPDISSASVRMLDVSLANVRTPGGPRHVFRFHAVEKGEAVVRIARTVDGPFPNPEFTITLSVK